MFNIFPNKWYFQFCVPFIPHNCLDHYSLCKPLIVCVWGLTHDYYHHLSISDKYKCYKSIKSLLPNCYSQDNIKYDSLHQSKTNDYGNLMRACQWSEEFYYLKYFNLLCLIHDMQGCWLCKHSWNRVCLKISYLRAIISD